MLILPTTVVLAIAILETRVLYDPPSNAPTRGLVWAGRTFVTRADFALFLRSRGLTYRTWVRRHPAPASVIRSPWGRRPAAVQRAAELRRSHRRYGWILGGLAGIALLATLSLLLETVRRSRLPAVGRWTRRILQPVAALRPVPAAKGGARPILRLGQATTLLSSMARKFPAQSIRLRGTELASAAAHRATPAARAGALLMMRWATATALLSASLAASSANTVRRRRSDVAWYLVAALFAAGVGIVATVWLNRA
jgi:hypothetical protein